MKEEPVRRLSIYPSKLITLNSVPRSYDALPVICSHAACFFKRKPVLSGKIGYPLRKQHCGGPSSKSGSYFPGGNRFPRKRMISFYAAGESIIPSLVSSSRR